MVKSIFNFDLCAFCLLFGKFISHFFVVCWGRETKQEQKETEVVQQLPVDYLHNNHMCSISLYCKILSSDHQ